MTTIGTDAELPLIAIQHSAIKDDTRYLFSFDAVVNSGTPILVSVYIGGEHLVLNHTILNGYNEFEFTTTGTNVNQYVKFNGTNLFDIELTNVTTKEVVLPTESYSTYLDYATMTHKQLSASGDVGEELVTLDFEISDFIPYGTNTIDDNGNGTMTMNCIDDSKGGVFTLGSVTPESCKPFNEADLPSSDPGERLRS